MRARTTVFVVYPGLQLTDLVGPLEILGASNNHHLVSGGRRRTRYDLVIASPSGRAVRSSIGLPIAVERSCAQVRGPIHTLIVPGSFDVDGMLATPGLIEGVRRLARRASRVVAVCSGAFVLAEAGLLDGRRATTHWAGCARLARDYPSIEVAPDPIFVRDGAIWTSAGVTAGMDLALALVEEDVGRDVALLLARWFVMYLRRPGGQSQFSAHLNAQLADHDAIRDVLQWMADRPGSDLSVAALARRAKMSPRNFARVFRAQVGVPPGQHCARVRLETARRRLEESADALKTIAADCGFGTVESLRRAFHSALRVTPGEYRERFQRAVG